MTTGRRPGSGPRPTKPTPPAPDALVVRPRVAVLLIAALSLSGAAWAAARARAPSGPDAAAPVMVGEERIARAELAGDEHAIERRWLAGEAAARGLRPAAQPAALRAQVADALAGPRPLPAPARFAALFDGFHARWRARTRCVAGVVDPREDRCRDAGTVAGGCRWMGEATVCGAGRRWLIVASGVSRSAAPRLRSRAAAIKVARALYATARARRDRAAAAERVAVARERAARERAARRRDPRLAGPALASARAACARQLRDSDPYLFGFGTQDVPGQAEGLITARAALAGRLRAAARDDIDRDKLRPLLDAIGAGNRALVRIARANAPDVAGLVARFDRATEPERVVSRRLGLGDCLARPRG